MTTPTASPASSAPKVDVQPLGGVLFSFDVRGQLGNGLISRLPAVCDAVAALAGEPPAACSVVSVSEAAAPAAGSGAATRRLASTGYLHVVLAIHPSSRTEEQVEAALVAAAADGRLADALAALGVPLAGGAPLVLNAAVPSDSKATVGAAVGGAVGGAAIICLAAATFLVVRRRRREARTASSRLPVSSFVAHHGSDDAASVEGKVKVRRVC